MSISQLEGPIDQQKPEKRLSSTETESFFRNVVWTTDGSLRTLSAAVDTRRLVEGNSIIKDPTVRFAHPQCTIHRTQKSQLKKKGFRVSVYKREGCM